MFNSSSPTQLSILFFGGTIEKVEEVCDGVYKTGVNKGLPKIRKLKSKIEIPGLGLKPLASWKTKKAGIYSTNEAVLDIIAKKDTTDAGKIAKLMLISRGLFKQIGTYYEGLSKFTYDIDGCIHQQYQHVWLETGRLSCTKPNSQNQPRPPSKVTQHFISRFVDGLLVSADYKSIEPRVEAEDCQDPQLIEDVINELDAHTKNLALAERVSYEEANEKVQLGEWKSKRTQIKAFTFAQQYLAGVATTAKNSGLTEQEVTDILEARQIEYSQLYEWHNKNYAEATNKGFYTGILGRRFYFQEKQGSYGTYWSKNEMANYRTQGTAADIVLIMLGKLWREKAIYKRDKYLLINTVHDSIMLDCKKEYVEEAKKDLKILETWPEVCSNKFKYQWTVPILIDISVGTTWFDL